MKRLLLLSLFLPLSTPVAAQSFEEALSAAYQRNPGIEARRAELRALDESVAEAMSGYRPSLEAGAGIGASRQEIKEGGMISGTDHLTPRDAGVTLTQPLFKGFRTEGAVAAADARVQAARAHLRGAEQSLLFETAKAYLDVLESRKIVELTRANEIVLRQQLEATTSRFNVGEVTKTDVAQAAARLSAASAERTGAEGDLAGRQALLTRLTGLVTDDLTQQDLSLPLPATMEEAIALAEKNNPFVLAATFGREAAEADIDVAKGSLLPEVNLIGNVSRAWDQSLMLPTRQDNATIMARVTIPLYRSGADYARTRAAQNTAVQRRLEIEEARRQARETATRAWENLRAAAASRKALARAKKANELALYGVQEESKVGNRTILDILNAQQELLSSDVNLVKARHDEAIALLQIHVALGSLSPEKLRLPIESYVPSTHYEAVKNKWIGLE